MLKNKRFCAIDFVSYLSWIWLLFNLPQKLLLKTSTLSDFDTFVICDVRRLKGNNRMSSIMHMGQLFIHISCVSCIVSAIVTCSIHPNVFSLVKRDSICSKHWICFSIIFSFTAGNLFLRMRIVTIDELASDLMASLSKTQQRLVQQRNNRFYDRMLFTEEDGHT